MKGLDSYRIIQCKNGNWEFLDLTGLIAQFAYD